MTAQGLCNTVKLPATTSKIFPYNSPVHLRHFPHNQLHLHHHHQTFSSLTARLFLFSPNFGLSPFIQALSSGAWKKLPPAFTFLKEGTPPRVRFRTFPPDLQYFRAILRNLSIFGGKIKLRVKRRDWPSSDLHSESLPILSQRTFCPQRDWLWYFPPKFPFLSRDFCSLTMAIGAVLPILLPASLLKLYNLTCWVVHSVVSDFDWCLNYFRSLSSFFREAL